MSLFSRIRRWLPAGSAEEDESPEPMRAGEDGSDRTPVAVVGLAESYAAYRDGARFVDVREPAEWAKGHIAGAVHYPVADVEARPRLAVAPETPVVTYCAAGARAARAAASLAAHGYSDVRALQSGYADWQQAGYPVEIPDDVTRA